MKAIFKRVGIKGQDVKKQTIIIVIGIIGVMQVFLQVKLQKQKQQKDIIYSSNRPGSPQPEISINPIEGKIKKRGWLKKKIQSIGMNPGQWQPQWWERFTEEEYNTLRYEFLRDKKLNYKIFSIIIYDTAKYHREKIVSEFISEYCQEKGTYLERILTISKKNQKQVYKVYENGKLSSDSTILGGLWDKQPEENWTYIIDRGIIPQYIQDPIDKTYKEVSIRQDIQEWYAFTSKNVSINPKTNWGDIWKESRNPIIKYIGKKVMERNIKKENRGRHR